MNICFGLKVAPHVPHQCLRCEFCRSTTGESKFHSLLGSVGELCGDKLQLSSPSLQSHLWNLLKSSGHVSNFLEVSLSEVVPNEKRESRTREHLPVVLPVPRVWNSSRPEKISRLNFFLSSHCGFLSTRNSKLQLNWSVLSFSTHVLVFSTRVFFLLNICSVLHGKHMKNRKKRQHFLICITCFNRNLCHLQLYKYKAMEVEFKISRKC